MSTTMSAPADTMTFADLGVPAAIADTLAAQGIIQAFPIQAGTLPDSLNGRDVLGRGRTGSGKTLAFVLPLLARLAADGGRSRPGAPRALVLVPTRELAAQVQKTLTPLADAVGMRTAVVIGGVNIRPQITALRRGVDVVVATPGRLEDLMSQGECRLDQVQVSVLDEADHMADLGFLPPVKRILGKTPERSQRLLFSATLDRGVDVLVKRFLHQPVEHSVDDAQSHVPLMKHHVLNVRSGEKAEAVKRLLAGPTRTIAFTRTKRGARNLARTLNAAGIGAVDLHGNLTQNARQRNLAAFEGGTVDVLVATDIAARGIHVDDIGLVVHVDVPADHKTLLHRSGRTARAGAEGHVVSVVAQDQAGEFRQLSRRAGVNPARLEIGQHPVTGRVADETGAPSKPAIQPAASETPSRGGRGGSGAPSTRGRRRSGGRSSSSASANRSSSSRSSSSRSGSAWGGGTRRSSAASVSAGMGRRR